MRVAHCFSIHYCHSLLFSGLDIVDQRIFFTHTVFSLIISADITEIFPFLYGDNLRADIIRGRTLLEVLNYFFEIFEIFFQP